MSDHTDMPMAPSGAMSPVDTSSPTTITTRASISSGGGSGTGGGTRLGPRMISTRFAAARGKRLGDQPLDDRGIRVGGCGQCRGVDRGHAGR